MITWSDLLRFQPHIDVWLLVAGLATGYAALARRHLRATGETVPRRTVALFTAGLAVLWLASDWPLDDVGERSLLAAHMLQYLLLAMVAPGLLLLGLPAWMVDRLLRPRALRWAARRAARPLTAWLTTTAVLLLSHWNPVVDAYLANDLVHLVMHVAWVSSGLVLWWPILSCLPEAPALGRPAQIGYLIVQSIIPTVPATFLTFGTGSVLRAYGQLPKPPGIDVVTDQQIAGLLMKVGGGVILWLAITIIFFRWSVEEAGTDRSRAAVRP